ncbi:MAG TPA: hypothetical protein VGR15_07780 [Bacteroidota bacterium]|jgi:hypothetical protein|nr:hypothetical protein [Bacteroidota bacterium]
MKNMFVSFSWIRRVLPGILVGMGFLLPACTSQESGPVSGVNESAPGGTIPVINTVTGNGAPSGPHFNLNLIGVPKDKTAPMDNNNGHRIFVKLEGVTKILLSQGDFQVLDANGTDGTASFRLPSPDPDNDGVTAYSVYARALGKPGGRSISRTCASDSTGATFCSTEALLLVRSTGKSSFTNVSKYLLYLYVDLNGDGVLERVPLFDPRLQDYFWSYDNQGMKLVQLRFYQISSTVP